MFVYSSFHAIRFILNHLPFCGDYIIDVWFYAAATKAKYKFDSDSEEGAPQFSESEDEEPAKKPNSMSNGAGAKSDDEDEDDIFKSKSSLPEKRYMIILYITFTGGVVVSSY